VVSENGLELLFRKLLHKRVVPYSIQGLERLRPGLFCQDLMVLLDLLQQRRIKPIIARRFPLPEARLAQESLGHGGVVGKIMLQPKGSPMGLGSGQTAPHRLKCQIYAR
jgi:NADPH:quinone reductase-like Zn-dependent oxidoreductase